MILKYIYSICVNTLKQKKNRNKTKNIKYKTKKSKGGMFKRLFNRTPPAPPPPAPAPPPASEPPNGATVTMYDNLFLDFTKEDISSLKKKMEIFGGKNLL